MADIRELLSAFQTISPDKDSSTELEARFQQFADFIWNNTFHDEVAVKPTVSEHELSGSTNEKDVECNLRETESMVHAFHLSRKIMMSEEFSRMTEEQVRGLSIADFCKKYGYSEDYLHNMFERDDVSKTIQTYIQYSEKIKLFVKKVQGVQVDSQAIDTYAEVRDNEQPISDYFEGVDYDEQQLRILCSSLVESHWLDSKTKVDDFVYFFSGNGSIPTQRLKWMKETVILSIFLKEVTRDRYVWKKAAKIFLAPSRKDGRMYPVNATNIRNGYSNASINESYQYNRKQVMSILSMI